MRRRRTLIVLALALVSGALAGYSALQLMQRRPATVIASPPNDRATQIVVAARDIEVGEKLAEEDVKLIEWPGDIVPEGFARTKADVLGRGVLAPVKLNEALLESKLADRTGGFGLPIRIDEGMRALSFRVSPEMAVGGYYQATLRADLMLITTPPGSNETEVRTIKQNVRLLSADARTAVDPEGQPVSYTLATVLVTPEDAEDIVLAKTQGEIWLTLRNPLDLEEIRTRGARMTRLYAALPRTGGTRAARPATGGRPPATTDASGVLNIIRGSEVARIRIGGR